MANEVLRSMRALVSATAVRKEVRIGLAGRGLLLRGTKVWSTESRVRRCRKERLMEPWQQKGSTRLLRGFGGAEESDVAEFISCDVERRSGWGGWISGYRMISD